MKAGKDKERFLLNEVEEEEEYDDEYYYEEYDDELETGDGAEESKLSAEAYTLYPYRWKLQIAFSIAIASTTVLMVGFSPIAKVIAHVFECSVRTVEAQTLIFLAAFVPANFTGIHLLTKKGLKYTLVIGGLLVLAGAWLRLLVNITGIFAIASIGSIFAAFG